MSTKLVNHRLSYVMRNYNHWFMLKKSRSLDSNHLDLRIQLSSSNPDLSQFLAQTVPAKATSWMPLFLQWVKISRRL